MRRRIEQLAALALAGALAAPAAWAQDAPAQGTEPGGVEEIIVTSRLREESIQEVPLAVQQFGQEAIESIAPSTLRDFDGLTPNVFIGMNTAGPGASAIYIRGLGYADIEKTQTPNVGVVIDGVFVPSSTGQLIDTFDIEAIEINRGPQAILWGRNTSGGTIVVRRGRPVLGEYDARLLVAYGDYHGEGDGGAFKVQAMANIPLIDETLALRVGYTYKDEDGYAKNVARGPNGFLVQNPGNRGAVDYNAINAKLLYQPTERLSVVLNWDWIEDRSDIPPQDARWDGNDPFINKSDRVPSEKAPYDVSVTSLTVDYELPFGATLTSISSYWNSRDFVLQDFDAGVSNPLDPTQNDPQSVFARLHTHRAQTFDTFSQELRLVGSLFDESLHYTAGYYFATDDHDHEQRTEQQLQLPDVAFGGACVPGIPGFSGPTDPSTGTLYCVLPTTFSLQETHLNNKSWAVFGSLEYELPWIEGLSANFGVRYINEDKEFRTAFYPIANNVLIDPVRGPAILELGRQDGSWDDVVFEAGARYQLLENLMTYYRFAQGYRSGGFSLRGSQPVGTAADPRSWSLTFDPEDVDSHEVGVKSTWWEGRIVVNLAGFYNDIQGAQGSSIINGVTPVGTNTLILNGGKTEVYGVELQTSLEVLEGLHVDFNLGWQDGESKESTQSTHNLPFPAGDTVCRGTTAIPLAQQSEATCPTITFSGGALARTPELTWSVGVSYSVAMGPGELVLGSRVRRNDDFWIIPPLVDPASGAVTNTPVEQTGYTLYDANISYEFPVMERSVRVGFVGRNLSDERYKEQELPLGPGGFRGWGPPRYLGGELNIDF